MESLGESSSSVPSQNNELPEINCSEHSKCTICLQDITNKCYSDSCMHTFCFECLRRWSYVQPFCPLCKNIFKKIHHSFTSDGLHDTYIVPSQEVIDHEDLEMNLLIEPFRRNDGIPSTDVLAIQNFNDNNIAPGYVYNDTVGNHHNYGVTFHYQVIGEITTIQVYSENWWARPLPDINGRFRDFNIEFLRNHPNERNRLREFIHRDLLAIRSLGRFGELLSFTHISTIISTIMQIMSTLEIRRAFMSDVLQPSLGIYTEHFCHELFNYAYSPYDDLTGYDNHVHYIRSEEIITAGFNIPVPEDLRIHQGETVILDDEDIDNDTSQFQSEIIELSCDSSDTEIVNTPSEPPVVNPPDETLNRTSFNDQPSTSTGIRNSLNEPNNRYNLRKRRLFPSTSSSSSCPANLSNKKSQTQLRRENNINSSSSDEEYMTSSDESVTSSGEEFIPSARGSQCLHLDKPVAFKRKKKNKFKKQKKE